MNIKSRILVVEDEKATREYIASLIMENNYQLIEASNGLEALSMAASHLPELILLDLGLPDIDGINVLKSIRCWSKAPVIILSARQEERDKIEAFDMGANDYITKPFGAGELLARIRTALRQHTAAYGAAQTMSNSFHFRRLYIDGEKMLVMIDGKSVHLTPTEYRILTLLARNAGKVLTHEFIIHEIWGPYATDSQTLRVNMANIRRKIEADPAKPAYLTTEIGVGYRFAIDNENG